MTTKALSRLMSATIACVVATATNLTSAAPGAVSNFLTVNFSSGECGSNNGCVFFSGDVFPQLDGVVIGLFGAGVFDVASGNAFAVSCTGPQYAAAMSVNAGGAASVQITLDPEASGCSSNVFFGTASVITINVTGKPDGNFKSSITGVEQDTFNNGTGTVTVRLNTQNDCYSEVFTGTVIAPIAVGNLQGTSCIQHRVQF